MNKKNHALELPYIIRRPASLHMQHNYNPSEAFGNGSRRSTPFSDTCDCLRWFGEAIVTALRSDDSAGQETMTVPGEYVHSVIDDRDT